MKLMPCPFCGCSGDIEGNTADGYWVECANCGVETTVMLAKGNAVEMWNSRYTPPEQRLISYVALQERCNELLASLQAIRDSSSESHKWCREVAAHTLDGDTIIWGDTQRVPQKDGQ